MMYVWTKKAERYWRRKRPRKRWKERIAGKEALFMGEPIEEDTSVISLCQNLLDCGWIRKTTRRLVKFSRRHWRSYKRAHFSKCLVARWKLIQWYRLEGYKYDDIDQLIGQRKRYTYLWVYTNKKKYAPFFWCDCLMGGYAWSQRKMMHGY